MDMRQAVYLAAMRVGLLAAETAPWMAESLDESREPWTAVLWAEKERRWAGM